MSHSDSRSEKSRRAILDAANGILARDRSASMSAIATAIGIGRATLHRHFPTRNDLISAIANDAIDHVSAAIAESQPERGPVIDSMQRIATAVIPLANELHILNAGPEVWDLPGLNDRWYSVTSVLEEMVRRGQREGEIRTDLTPAWITDVFAGTILTAAAAIGDGRLAANDAPALVVDATIRGVGAR